MSGMMRAPGPIHPICRLTMAIAAALCGIGSGDGQTLPTAAPKPPFQCQEGTCRTMEQDLLYRIRPLPSHRQDATSARRSPTVSASDATTHAVSEPDHTVMLIPNGGTIWLTEDPAFGTPELTVSAPSVIAYANGKVQAPVTFYIRTNYSDFFRQMELRIFRATDVALSQPLATIALPLGTITHVDWDGQFATTHPFHLGDQLVYIVRARDGDGQTDETAPQTMQLVTPADAQFGRQQLRDTLQKQHGLRLYPNQAELLSLQDAAFSHNGLRQQNILIHCARLRIQGQNLPPATTLKINDQSYPVDQHGTFVAEYLVPISTHTYTIDVQQPNTARMRQSLTAQISGHYLFSTGLADLTLYHDRSTGPGSDISWDGRNRSVLDTARLAFYMKGKTQGRYLLTAQADTQNRPIRRLFTGFTTANPQDLFRSLDPDVYYPTYGDHSTTWRDVDTQGHFYTRLEWDKNQALWGNYATGLSGTEYIQYIRALYGASTLLRSNQTTIWGEPRSQLRAFAARERTAPGHSELLGTGGSLYYLRHANLLQGSDQAFVEIRDPTTGRVDQRFALIRGADYEIDPIQGRLLLTKPLAQISRDHLRRISRDHPLDGNQQRLIVDYEWTPTGLDSAQMTAGFHGKQWFGQHVGIGVTAVDENRAGDDYALQGIDLTVQASRATYLTIEQGHSRATSTPAFFSDNGGLRFIRRNPSGQRSGNATAIEGRLSLTELGWIQSDWSAGGWWRHLDPGYSVARSDTGLAIEQWGADAFGSLTATTELYLRYSQAHQGQQRLIQAQASAQSRLTERDQIETELRRVEEPSRRGGQATGLLGAARYTRRLNDMLSLFIGGQLTLSDDHNRYGANNALNVGGLYTFGNDSSLGADLGFGQRGNAVAIQGHYQRTPQHSVYANVTESPDRTAPFAAAQRQNENGWTIGQRWRISNQTAVFNENQFLKQSGESGLANTFGIDFYPAYGWSMATTLSTGTLDSHTGSVHRRAISASVGRSDTQTDWQTKIEWRHDRGTQRRTQWVSTNRVQHAVTPSLQLAGRFNYARTNDRLSHAANVRFIESNVGFAYRPIDTDRWALLGRYTYLYDLAPLEQRDSDSQYDQNSRILLFEGLYRLNHRWEMTAKRAWRYGRARYGRGQGAWFDTSARFAAIQARYELFYRWHGIAEYRWLTVKGGGQRQGWLLGIDRDINTYLRCGVGFNFTDFRDDLTDLNNHQRGWYFNLTGRY